MQDSRILISEWQIKAKESSDEILIWLQAAQVDDKQLKEEAIRHLDSLNDPRALPTLDALSRDQVEDRRSRGCDDPPYPILATGAALKIRDYEHHRQIIHGLSATDAAIANVACLNSAADWIEKSLAFKDLMKEPSSPAAVTALIALGYNYVEAFKNYLIDLDPTYSPQLLSILRSSNDSGTVSLLAIVCAKRKMMDAIPVLIAQLLSPPTKGRDYAPPALEQALAYYHEDAMPLISAAWTSADWQQRWCLSLAIIYRGTIPAFAAVRDQFHRAQDELRRYRASHGTDNDLYREGVHYLEEVRLSVRGLDSADDQNP